MRYSEFAHKVEELLMGESIRSRQVFEGRVFEETVSGRVFVDKMPTSFQNIEDALQDAQHHSIVCSLEEEIAREQYYTLSRNKTVDVIKEHHGVKVTDTLLEAYAEAASTKIFSLDPVIVHLRESNTLDRIVESKIDFRLNDGSLVAIDLATLSRLNNIIGNQTDIIEHMRESSQTFLDVLNLLEE